MRVTNAYKPTSREFNHQLTFELDHLTRAISFGTGALRITSHVDPASSGCDESKESGCAFLSPL
jgi:hypothetical protein